MREAKCPEQRPSFSPHLLPQPGFSEAGALVQRVPVKETPLVCPPSVCPGTARCRAALQGVIKMMVVKSLSTVSGTRMRAAVLLMREATGVFRRRFWADEVLSLCKDLGYAGLCVCVLAVNSKAEEIDQFLKKVE